ncbi:MAG: MotA/TolQ/ExbB proton channel family protein [Gammaproteobacteria bacterium]|nr:MotA/TolQ/ExbB proton channel family protein [Gammaproteobacteria bacterium]
MRHSFTTIFGIILGVGVCISIVMLSGNPSGFLNIPSLVVVVGGTLAATLIKFPGRQISAALRAAVALVARNAVESPQQLLQLAQRLAAVSRQHGVLALEAQKVANPFFRKGIQMCADQISLDKVRRVLLEEMEMAAERDEQGQKVFRGIADSAPAFGIIGTVVGLVDLLGHMDDPYRLGPAMAIALLTTLYGALIAHLVALPIADRLEAMSLYERMNKMLIIEGVAAIYEGQHPVVMRDMLAPYVVTQSEEIEPAQPRRSWRLGGGK